MQGVPHNPQEPVNSRQAGRPRDFFEISGQVVKELEKVEVDFSVAVVCVF